MFIDDLTKNEIRYTLISVSTGQSAAQNFPFCQAAQYHHCFVSAPLPVCTRLCVYSVCVYVPAWAFMLI